MLTAPDSPPIGGAHDDGRAHFRSCSQIFLTLEALDRSQLELAMVRGATPDLDWLIGWEFRGVNTPSWARVLGIKKFIKGFFRGATPHAVHGYNLPVVQNALSAPWIPRSRSSGEAQGAITAAPFGFFSVAPVDPESRDCHYLHACLLNYEANKTGRLDPLRGLRDYLVQPDPGNPDVILGKAYYRLGPVAVATNFFALERYRRIDDR